MPAGKRRAYEALRRAKASFDATVGAIRSRTSREARRRNALKDAEISTLRRELARARGDARGDARGEENGAIFTASLPAFFVVGNQKSGTTWLMRMLDAHPEVLCRGEGRFFGASWRQEGLKDRDVLRPPSSLHNAILDAEYLRLWIERSVWSRNDDADEHLNNLTRMAVDYFLQGELLKSGKRIAGDKSPLLVPGTIREISTLYPEARVVHIIRDGRDVAVSAAHHARNFGKKRKNGARREDPGRGLFDEPQLRKLAADWAARVGRTVEDGPALLGTHYTEVRYEALITDPEPEVRRLLAFLAVDAGADAARRCVRSASFERLSKGRSPGEEDPSSFFRKGVAGDWRNTFSARDRRVFDEEAGALLARLGYEKNGGLHGGPRDF